MIVAVLVESVRSLRARWLRSATAALGVAIAVGSVVAGGTALFSAASEALRRLDALGARTLVVSPKPITELGAIASRRYLTTADLPRLRAEVVSASQVSAEQTFVAEVTACGVSRLATIVVTSADGLNTLDRKLVRAQVFSSAESFDGASNVAVVSESLFREFHCLSSLPANLQIGRSIVVARATLAASKGQSRLPDSVVLLPARFVERRFADSPPRAVSFRVQAKSVDALETTRDEIVRALRRAHGLQTWQADDFAIVTQADLVQQHGRLVRSSRTQFFLLLSWTFFLGATCVANAIAASVAERTNEIGLRRALGATRRAIQWQFLAEGLMLTSVGAVLGVSVGSLAGTALATNWLEVPGKTDVNLILITAGTTLVMGLLASVVPASRAADIRPIEALES